MRAKVGTLDEIRKSIVVAAESDDDTTRSSSGGASSGVMIGATGANGAAQPQRKPDLSLLRKPILTAVTGFLEAHRAYEAGTDEIRRLLAGECDLMYECRVCRNVFRCLTNFISHKRVYCRELFNAAQNFHFQNDGFMDQDITTIFQAEEEGQREPKKAHTDVLNKDLSSIVERLKRKQFSSNAIANHVTEYYDRINSKVTQDDLKRQQHVLQLDKVPQSRAAVYQTVRRDVIADNMQARVVELENLTNNNNTILGLDGKVLDPSSRPQSTMSVPFDSTSQYFKPIEPLDKASSRDDLANDRLASALICQECNLQFDTISMLQLHDEMKHTPSTFVYSCPSCPQNFKTPALVLRHLSTDHNKPLRRIKAMREGILKRRIRVDEIVSKGPSRELSRLLQSGTGSNTRTSSPLDRKPSIEEHDEAAATRAWMENLENFDHGPMCSYCGKSFERKAVLTTHKQTCPQRIRQTENGAASVPLPSKTGSSSGRRSKVKHATQQLSPAEPVKIKQEPIDSMPASSDESNSYDVPLAKLQTRISQDSVFTIKPEEITALSGCDEKNRRKRKKATIMLRNASDDISFEVTEPEQSSLCKDEEFSVPVVKNEPIEYSVAVKLNAPKAKRGPRNRKKPVPEEEINEQVMKELFEANGAIVCRCGKRYVDPEQYKHHLRVFHNRQRRFWCAVCDFKGYRKVDTINHLVQNHGYAGDQKDISSLINFQPVEKDDKALPEESQSIMTVIETVNRSYDTSATDISFTEVTECSTSVDALDTTHELSLVDVFALTEPDEPSPRKRARQKSVRDSLLCPSTKAKPLEKDDDSSTTSSTSKRPIRNRIKPVDKDFVYDLTHLLHKEEDLEDFPLPELVVADKPAVVPAAQTVAVKPPKFESSRTPPVSVAAATPPPEKRVESKRQSLRSHAPKPLPSELIRGAAYQMAKRQVDLGLAAFHRPPIFPQERAFNPGTIAARKQRSAGGIHEWPVIKKERRVGSISKNKSDIQIKRKYTKRASTTQLDSVLPELIREKRKAIPRRNSVVPLPQKISASIEILNKLNASRSAAGLEVVRMGDFPAARKCLSESDLRKYIDAHLTDYRKKLSQVNLNGTTAEDVSPPAGEPRKRITLLQRLQENKKKQLQQSSTPKRKDGTQPSMELPSLPPGPQSPSPPTLAPPNGNTATPVKVTDALQAKFKKNATI